MTEETLERVGEVIGGENASSEREQVESTSTDETPTLERTYTESEWRKAQSSWDARIAESKMEADKIKAQLKLKELEIAEKEFAVKELEAENHKWILDRDPDALEGYKDSKRRAMEQRQIERQKAELALMQASIDEDKMKGRLAYKALQLAEEEGVPVSVFKECQTEREMTLAAQVHKATHISETRGRRVDSAQSSGSSSQIPLKMEQFQRWIANMSPAEYENRKPEIDKALAEGKIK